MINALSCNHSHLFNFFQTLQIGENKVEIFWPKRRTWSKIQSAFHCHQMKPLRFLFFLLGCSFVLVLWSVTSIYEISFDFLIYDKVKNKNIFEVINTEMEGDEIEGGENVFFVETHSTNDHDIDSRQACSIESAGRISWK